MSQLKTICVVDDDVAILEVVRLVLEEEGYKVVTDTGPKAVDIATHLKPDLVLLDVWMQGLDGCQISRAIKEDKTQASVPVVLMSAHSDAIKSVEDAKADGFLEKPFGMDELIRVVERMVE